MFIQSERNWTIHANSKPCNISFLLYVFHNVINNLSASVVFQATGVRKSNGYSTGETVVFPTVTYNEGSGYSSSTGKFTAPVSGLYAFAKQVCTTNTVFAATAFVHNGQTVLASWNVGHPSYYGCGSAQALVRMASGDQMWVKNTDEHTLLYTDTNGQISFTGTLMHI